jgi:hypothetical protein
MYRSTGMFRYRDPLFHWPTRLLGNSGVPNHWGRKPAIMVTTIAEVQIMKDSYERRMKIAERIEKYQKRKQHKKKSLVKK